MKTTVEINDELLNDAKRLASEEHSTLRQLIEAGLRNELNQRRQKNIQPYHMRDASVGGRGIRLDFAGRSWETIRAAIYEGQGE